MLPLFEEPGDWTVAAAPVGSPCTLSVTFPIVPWRLSVTLIVVAGCPENTSAEAGENDSDRLPMGLEFPPPPQAARPNREKQARSEATVRMRPFYRPVGETAEGTEGIRLR